MLSFLVMLLLGRFTPFTNHLVDPHRLLIHLSGAVFPGLFQFLHRQAVLAVALLDLGLPDTDGVDIIKKIRTWSNMPIIVISARNEDKDKIEALDAGADDYVTKPFSVEELLARLRATTRRLSASGQTQAEDAVFENGELRIEYAAGCAWLGDKELHLTPIEYKLLCLLARNVGKVLTHTYIMQQIWGSSGASDIASLRVFMATLRKKIDSSADGPQYIQTHIGVGYRMMKVE